LAWRFRYGTHVVASSAAAGVRHAVYISKEEVIHREDSGEVVSEPWVKFLLRFPQWREVAWPEDDVHADQVVERARLRVGATEARSGYLLNSSEHFVNECFFGVASSSDAQSKVTTVASLATGGAAAGAAAASAASSSSIAMSAAATAAAAVGGGALVAGAAAGAAAGALLAAPIYWSWRQSARHESLGRLPFCVINETMEPQYIRVYRADDSTCLVPIYGLSGNSEGSVAAGHLLELDPPDDSEEFRVIFGQRGYIMNTESLRAFVRRGSVYRLNESDGGVSKAAAADALGLNLARIPRGVLPAYRPG